MKIAFMHYWTLQMRRGIETLVLSLANELSYQGINVTILTARQSQEPLVKPDSKVSVHEFPATRYFGSLMIVPFYAIDLVKHRYDVVVTFFADFGEGWAVKLAAPFCRPRHLLYLAFPYEAAPHRYKSYQRWGWDKSADLVLADAEYTARDGEKLFNRVVHVLPSGTDSQKFRAIPELRRRARQELGYSEQDFILLNVSALEERKGTWRVIEALPEILKILPNVRFLVLGKGSQEDALQRRTVQLGLGSIVKFAGTTSDLLPYYNAADLFVMLSEGEAGSVALLEAMSCELPPVVSDAGGFGEVVNSSNGRIVPLQDNSSFVETVVSLANDPVIRAGLGRKSRQTVVEKYSWKNLALQMIELLSV